MMTWGILLVLALFMRFGPDIPFRRMLNRHLVERPLNILLARRRHQLVFMIIAPLMLLLGGEAILIFGPELMLAYAADVALYIDLVVIAAASASWTRAHAALSRWRPRFLRQDKRKASGATPRARRSQRTPARLTGANDDDGEGRDAGGFEVRWSNAAAA